MRQNAERTKGKVEVSFIVGNLTDFFTKWHEVDKKKKTAKIQKI